MNKQTYSDKNNNILKFETTRAYKLSQTILLNITQIIANMPKAYKYNLGKDLSDCFFKVIHNIVLAYESEIKEKKLEHLNITKENIFSTIIWLRMVNDINGVKRKNYTETLSMIINLKGQIQNWISSLESENNK